MTELSQQMNEVSGMLEDFSKDDDLDKEPTNDELENFMKNVGDEEETD